MADDGQDNTEARDTSPDPQETIRRLRQVAKLRRGQNAPAWFGDANDWGPALSKLCGDAADLLERTLP
jgi:hypothetical protein